MEENNQKVSDTQRMEELLEMNLNAMESIKKDVHAIYKFFRWRAVFSVIWIIVVIAPTILAIIYIPTFIKSYMNSDLLKNPDLLKMLGI